MTQSINSLADKIHQSRVDMYVKKALSRAEDKIKVRMNQDKREAVLNLEYPTNEPTDEFSAEVAYKVKETLESSQTDNFTVNLKQRVKHDGCYVHITW